jgi:ribosomal protein S18 acetylase RimI-like enzyme
LRAVASAFTRAGVAELPSVLIARYPRAVRIDDRASIGAYLRSDAALHLYEIGDLDPFFWPRTRWFGQGDPLEALCMIYEHPDMVTLLALCRAPASEAMNALLAQIDGELPERFYAHLGPGVAVDRGAFDHWHLDERGAYDKMVLTAPEVCEDVPADGVVALGRADVQEVERFYAACYPGNWFDPRMIDTGVYVGIRQGGDLVSVAGVHVLSPEQRVAALGNIATAPDRRGQGLGRRVTAAICRELASRVDVIGLNVRADNAAALRCYRGLGFERVASYREAVVCRG